MEELSESLREVMSAAFQEAARTGETALEPIHLFVGVLLARLPAVETALKACDLEAAQLIEAARNVTPDVPKGVFPRGRIRISGRVMIILAIARQRTDLIGRSLEAADVLAFLLLRLDAKMSRVVERASLPVQQFVDELSRVNTAGLASPRARVDSPRANPAVRTPILDRYGKDLSAKARQGLLPPVIGRRQELKQLVRSLLRSEKTSALLIGEPGVGKTAVVDGLAQLVASPEGPSEIRELRLVSIAVADLLAGAKYRGDVEERINGMIAEASADPNVVLFIDELHTVVGAGSGSGESMDAANILKPALGRGQIRIIGATTPAEFARYIERDPALERRFQPIRVEEPSPEEALAILRGLRAKLQEHHGVTMDDGALEAAVELSVRYLPDRRLPDKAQDLLDQAAANKRLLTLSPRAELESLLRVTRDDVAQVVAEWTSVPVDRLTQDEAERLLNLEEELNARVIGQAAAVAAVAAVVRAARAGLSDPKRPSGVLLFTGPTGVGKTELAKALAAVLFGDATHLLRFDMSEYMEAHSVSRLIGAPPGYVGHEDGGRLTEAVRRSPFSVVLLDEVEKAHPKIADLLLQVFDDGRLTDAQGRTADFRNTFIIMTSNLVISETAGKRRAVGFRRTQETSNDADGKDSKLARDALLSFFRPELINRISQVVHFEALGATEIRSIVDRLVQSVAARLKNQDIELELDEGAYALLTEVGFRPDTGARGMERAIEKHLVQPLAAALLRGNVGRGARVRIRAEANKLLLESAPDKPSSKTPQVAQTQSSAADERPPTSTVVHSSLRPETQEYAVLLSIRVVSKQPLADVLLDLRGAVFAHPAAAHLKFMSSSDHGLLLMLPTLRDALSLTRTLLSLVDEPRLDVRPVVHWGRVRIGPEGYPIGRDVLRVAGIEAATEADRAAPRGRAPALPPHGCVLTTRPVIDLLEKLERDTFQCLGEFRLSGFEEPEELWCQLD